MDIKLDFNAEEIAKKLHEAILSSAFKEMFERAAKAEIERLSKSDYWQGSRDSVIGHVITNYMRERMTVMLDTEYKEQIDTIIREKIISQKLDELCNQLVSKIQVKVSDY